MPFSAPAGINFRTDSGITLASLRQSLEAIAGFIKSRDTYGYLPDDFPHAHDNYRRSLSLPIYSAMSEPDVDRVVDEVLRLGEELA